MDEIFITHDFATYQVNTPGYLVRSILTGEIIISPVDCSSSQDPVTNVRLAAVAIPPKNCLTIMRERSWDISWRPDLRSVIPKFLALQHHFMWIP